MKQVSKRRLVHEKKFACLASVFLNRSYGRSDERIARQTRVLDFHLLAEPGGSAERNKIIDVASVSIEPAPHYPIREPPLPPPLANSSEV